MDAKTHAGTLIRAARQERGMSLTELAQKIAVSPATISLIERGKVRVRADRLTAIADAFELTPTDLFGDGAPDALTEPLDRGHRRILTAAIECFVVRGYHGTSMRGIAEAAGISVAGVYHYYPSKQAVLVAILDHTMDEVDERMAAAMGATPHTTVQPTAQPATPQDPASIVQAMVEALALFHAESQAIAFIGASEMRSLEPPEDERLTQRRRHVQNTLDTVIMRGVSEGAFTTTEPKLAGRIITNMCTSVATWFNPAGEASAAQVAARIAAYALSILGAHSATQLPTL